MIAHLVGMGPSVVGTGWLHRVDTVWRFASREPGGLAARRSADAGADRAQRVELRAVVLAGGDVDRRVQSAGHDELPGPQVLAQRVQGLHQPRHRLQRIAERCGARRGGNQVRLAGG
jgi:hypothetical protein